jgi:hypothetical protein
MNPEPRIVYDPREYDAAYVSALEMSRGTSARLDFSFFGALTELPEHGKIPVGDITFEGEWYFDHGVRRVHNPVVIEVKTKGDLAGSMLSGRLLWQIYHMWLLKMSGLVPGIAVEIRNVSEPLYKDAKASWKIARQALARWSSRYGFSILLAEEPEDVVDVAKSFMREYWDPKAVAMPPPLLKKELLDWDLGIQAICMVPGWYIELASRLMTYRTFWEVAIDAHEMDEEAFCDNYKKYYGFGGKDNLRLKSLWKAFNDIKLYKKVEFENVFLRKTPAELVKLAAEVKEMTKK